MLASGQPVGPRTYEMNLRAKPEELLDWDKPMSAQPTVVSEPFARVSREPTIGHLRDPQAAC